jgi:glyoxylase-like metal-dependent hydrolase (beta-lactamase superfamily II)
MQYTMNEASHYSIILFYIISIYLKSYINYSPVKAENFMAPNIEAFYDKVTGTVSYVVYDYPTGACIIIDSVLNYDHQAGRTSTTSADTMIAFVQSMQLQVVWILETHAHADHLSAAPYLKQHLGGQIAIGNTITRVQSTFKAIFNLGDDFIANGLQFDHLIADGETLSFGTLHVTAIATPGHTPACMAYQISDAIFIGDTLFMPDVGTSRCDFPGGDATTLYRSIKKILSYAPDTRLFMCHDYPPDTRAPAWQSTVADQRAHNIHVHNCITEEMFVQMRTARDATLAMPVLIFPSVQINIRAGHLPPAEDNGVQYLKIPINKL